MNREKICKALFMSGMCVAISVLLTPDISRATDGLEINKMTTLKVKYTCNEYTKCMNLEDLELKLNDKSYKSIAVKDNVAEFAVPSGKADYKILLDGKHSAENLEGTIHISDVGNTIIDLKTSSSNVGVSIKVDGLMSDMNNAIVEAPTEHYTCTGKLISKSDSKETVIQIEKGKLVTPIELSHGDYILELPETDNMKLLKEDISFVGDEIVIHPEFISKAVSFEINHLSDISLSGVVVEITNKTTKQTRVLDFSVNSDTYISLPVGDYSLKVTNHGIFFNNGYTKDFNITKDTENIVLELERDLSDLKIKVLSATGKGVPNSKFKIVNENDYEFEASTDINGDIRLYDLSVGSYRIEQLDTGEFNLEKAEPVELTLTIDGNQGLEITNQLKSKINVLFKPVVGGQAMEESVKVRLKGISTTNKFIDEELKTNGNNPSKLSLLPGLYSVQLETLTELYPVEHTLLSKLEINETIEDNVTWELEYSPLTEIQDYSRTMPITGKAEQTSNNTPIFGSLLALLSSGVFIYKMKK